MESLLKTTSLCHCLEQLELQDYRSLWEDHRAKKLCTGNAIQLLIAGQLQGSVSYQMIAEQLQANPALQHLTRLPAISPSTLSRKNNKMCTDTLETLFVRFVQKIRRFQSGVTKKFPWETPLCVLDGSLLMLPMKRSNWASYSKTQRGVKMHLRVIVADPKNLVYPDRMILSTADVNETELSLELAVDPEVIYVMDRGYQKHEHFERWDQAEPKIRFVTRVRENTDFEVTRDFTIPAADRNVILWDRKVKISKCSRRLRLVVFRDEQEKEYHLITNCFDVPAVDIAQMYKHRWQIELFQMDQAAFAISEGNELFPAGNMESNLSGAHYVCLMHVDPIATEHPTNDVGTVAMDSDLCGSYVGANAAGVAPSADANFEGKAAKSGSTEDRAAPTKAHPALGK